MHLKQNNLTRFKKKEFDRMLSFKLFCYISVLQISLMIANAISVPDPVAVYPLNSKYLSREIKDRLPPGILSDVSLAPGIDGKEGGSYQFAGNIGSYIEFPNNGRLDVKHSITILCWVYPQTTGGPLFQYSGTDDWGVHMWIAEGKLFALFSRRNYKSTIYLFYNALALAFNQWHYVGCSYDFISGEANLWLNGESVVKMNIGKEIELATQDEVRIGAVNMDERYFQGRITAAQVYDVALNAEQIKAVEGVGQGADVCADKKPCQNGGECRSSGDSYTCSCLEGFQGKNCENDINECITLHPCQNGGQCINTQGGYECKCKPGFTGKNCEKDEDDCLNAVCHNGGKCINGINSYTCDCKEGFIGEQCEWEKQGCFKEVKNKNKKAMGKVLGKFTKYKKNIKGAVEACMKAAKGKKLEIFGVRSKFICATTKGNADYKMHGASPKGCKEEGDYGVGVKLANYVYVLKKN